MQLRDWRNREQLGMTGMARQLGIVGVNPGGTLSRIEAGSRQPDADMIERIEILTRREVTAADMHETRLGWLRDNRPEKFEARVSPVAREAIG